MKAFDPELQFETLLNETDTRIAELASAFDRLRWLRDRIAEQHKALREATEEIDVMTESDLAAKFGIKADLLAHLRRTLNLPHVPFGTKIRYTRRNADEILDILSQRRTAPNGLKRAA